MANYGESAAARIRFDDDALANTYLKAGELMKGTLQGIADKEREQARLDREEARQAERDRKADILFQRETDKYNKELATEAAIQNQAKIGTTGYQEGTGLLGKYAEAANAKADEAYNTILSGGGSEDAALDAYSKTRSEVGKELWNQQQSELKYSNALIDTARKAVTGNLDQPVDATKLSQGLATLDIPFLKQQEESSLNLATELFKNANSDSDMNAASKEYKKITGHDVPANVLSSVSKDIRNFNQQRALEDIRFANDLTKEKIRAQNELKKLSYAASLERKKSKPGDTEKALDTANFAKLINSKYANRIVVNPTNGLWYDTKLKQHVSGDSLEKLAKTVNEQIKTDADKKEKFIDARTNISGISNLFKAKTGTALSPDNISYLQNYLGTTLKTADANAKAAAIDHILKNTLNDKKFTSGWFGTDFGGYTANDAFEKEITNYIK